MRVAVSNTSNQVMTKKIHGVAVSNTSDDGGGKEERRVDEIFFLLYFIISKPYLTLINEITWSSHVTKSNALVSRGSVEIIESYHVCYLILS